MDVRGLGNALELYRAQRRLRPPDRLSADRAFPIAAKWLLIGRWKAQAIPIWSLALFPLLGRQDHDAAHRRWWPFIGTPLYNAYLRLMGARIGSNAVAELPLSRRSART